MVRVRAHSVVLALQIAASNAALKLLLHVFMLLLVHQVCQLHMHLLRRTEEDVIAAQIITRLVIDLVQVQLCNLHFFLLFWLGRLSIPHLPEHWHLVRYKC